MSGVISFGKSAEQIWLVAGWAYRRFLGDVMATSPQDEKFVYAIQKAEALQGLSLPLMSQEDRELAVKLYKAIRHVAFTTAQNMVDEPLRWEQHLDATGQSMYLDGIQQLLAILENTRDDFA